MNNNISRSSSGSSTPMEYCSIIAESGDIFNKNTLNTANPNGKVSSGNCTCYCNDLNLDEDTGMALDYLMQCYEHFDENAWTLLTNHNIFLSMQFELPHLF